MVISVIALFCSIGGAALAVKKAPKNSVVKKSIKANAVTGVKIADGQVGTADLADGAVTAGKLAPGAATQAPPGPGSITGTMLANDAVTSAKIKDGEVGEADVAGSLLNDRSVGRSVRGAFCDPPPLQECIGLDMDMPRAGRVLLFADALISGSDNVAAENRASGACQISIDATTPVPGSEATLFSNGPTYEVGISMSQVTDVLPSGSHHFGLNCAETDPTVAMTDLHLSAISLSAE